MADVVEYPIIVSKLDPLIMRVNELILVVGSTTFTAKVKIGSMWTGFHINTSGLGEPIAKIPVDITNYNNTDIIVTTGKTLAYQHIAEEAKNWMDDLQDSFAKATAQQNIVDLLKELKAQLHFDFSGAIPTDPNIHIDETTSYIKSIADSIEDIKTQLSDLTTSIGDLKSSINSTNPDDNSISYRLSRIETALGTATDDTFGKVIASAVTSGLQTLTGEMQTMNTNINTVNTNVNTVSGKVTTVDTKVTTVDTKVGQVNTTVGTINTNVNTVKSDVTTVKSDVGTVKTNVNTVSNNVTTVSNNVDNVKSTVNTIHNTDVPDIKNSVTSSGGTTDEAVASLASTVNTINSNVNTINSNTSSTNSTVNSISSTVGGINTKATNTWNKISGLDTETLNDVICGDESIIIGDSTDGYFVRTELTKDNMITGPDNDKRVKADTN